MDDDGNFLYGTDNIQKRQVDFYKTLYQSEPLDNSSRSAFLDNVDKQITDQSKQYMDSGITKEEISKAIKKNS